MTLTTSKNLGFQDVARDNVIIIILYALGISTALAFNDMVKSFMEKYKHVIDPHYFQIAFVLILFSFTILIAYLTKTYVPL